jgi:hypothetical protein
MKIIDIYRKDDQMYPEICAFAHDMYKDKLSFNLTSYPEILFGITEGNNVYGCIGLNTSLRFVLFLHDRRLQNLIHESTQGVVFGEQSILAVRHFCIGLPILIAVAAGYGYLLGINKIVYAAIGVSQKTIRGFGLSSTVLGSVDLLTFPAEVRNQYVPWCSQHKPVTCILDTDNTLSVCRQVLNRYSQKVVLGKKLGKQML